MAEQISNILERIAQKTDRVKSRTQKEERASELTAAAQADYPSRVVFETNGTQRTPEGIETFLDGSEHVDLPLDLPARSVEWDVGQGSYRLRLETGTPTSVTVEGLDGQPLVEARKTDGIAVLDLSSGAVRVTAEQPIRSLRLERYTARSQGSVLLGPFEARGWVSAAPKGHGNWTCEVASNQIYEAVFGAGQVSPELRMRSDDLWRGSGRSEPAPTPIDGGLTHDTLLRLDPTEAQDLRFLEEVSAGVVHKAHERWEIDQTTAISSGHDYWRGVGSVFGLAPSDAPGFDPVYGKWAYVWGQPAGVSRAIDLANGEEVETPVATGGAYLVKVPFPEEFSVDGTYAAKATPVPESRATLPPGTHARAVRTRSPEEVFVRAEGKGLLRGIELTEREPMGPDGYEAARTREVKIPDGLAERRPEQTMSHHYR